MHLLRSRLLFVVCTVVMTGCGDAATSVLVEIDAAPPQVDRFTLTAALPNGRQVASDFAAAQPARALIVLAPVSQSVTVTVTAHLSDGSSPSVSGAVDAIPHQQVQLALSFAANEAHDLSPLADLAVNDLDLQLDLAAPVDLTPPRDLALPPDMTTFLARDTFVRPDQAEWGTASDGQIWGADANASAAFSIVGNAGAVTNTGLNSLQATLGAGTITDADVRVQVALAAVDQSQNGGPVIRRVDGANFYKAYIDGIVFVLQKRVASTLTALQTVSFSPTVNQYYWIRFQVTGTTLRAKVWDVGGTEPTAWMLDQTDSSLTTGNVGVRMQANGSASVKFRNFSAQ